MVAAHGSNSPQKRHVQVKKEPKEPKEPNEPPSTTSPTGEVGTDDESECLYSASLNGGCESQDMGPCPATKSYDVDDEEEGEGAEESDVVNGAGTLVNVRRLHPEAYATYPTIFDNKVQLRKISSPQLI